MYTQHTSQSQTSSGSMAAFSQEESIRTYGCKWAWCRSTFSDNAALVHHVIHDHARRAIPVRRRDISLLRRAEEGSGETLEFSYAFTGQSSGSDRARNAFDGPSKETQQDGASHLNEASSSLPSPPTSSLAGFSPLPTSHPSLQISQPFRSMSQINDESAEDRINASPHTPSHRALAEAENSFASLSSPTDSAASFAIADIPNSPSFSSLVEKSAKRISVPKARESFVAKGSNISRNHPLSNSTTSSTGSQISVEQHLTQTPESDNEDESDGEHHFSTNQGLAHGPLHSLQADAYPSQSHRNDIQTAQSPAFESQAQSYTQESEIQLANYDLLSQAPSQFQVDSFPYHYHGPKVSTSSLIEPQSSAPLRLSPPAPVQSPTYATSTPQRQNWYQPPHLVHHNHSKTADKRTRDEDDATESPGQHTRTPARSSDGTALISSPSKSKKFKSGTLHVSAPVHVPESTIEEEEPVQTGEDLMEDIYAHSQSSSDTESLEDFSYPPLQTQAPYQSQPWSQF